METTQENKKFKRRRLLFELRTVLEKEVMTNSELNINLPYDDSSFDNYILKTNVKDFNHYHYYAKQVGEEIFEAEKAYLSSRIDKLFEKMQKRYKTLFSFLDEKGLKTLREDFENIISDHCVYDISRVIEEQSLYVSIFPYQDMNMESKGFELSNALKILWNNIHAEDESELEKMPKNQLLEKLFASQGFDIYSKIDWENPNEKFLRSLYREMLNAHLDESNSQFLVFLVKINPSQYFDLKSGYGKILWKKGKARLINMLDGTGSFLELKLDKPFEIIFDGKENSNLIQTEDNKPYKYSAKEIYGLHKPEWEKAEFVYKNTFELPY